MSLLHSSALRGCIHHEAMQDPVVFSLQLFKRIWHVFHIGRSLFTLPCMALLCFTISVTTLNKSWALSTPLSWFWKKGAYKSCLMLWYMHMFQNNSEVDKTWTHTCRSMRVSIYSHLIITGWVEFFSSMHVIIKLHRKYEFEVYYQTYVINWQNIGQHVQKYAIDMMKCDTLFCGTELYSQILRTN
jgi:hypothetical protein